MPEINTIEIHVNIKSIDCPKSGWLIKRITIDNKIEKLKKYETLEVFILSEVKMLAVNKIKNGFIISIGCNRKKYKLNQRFEPLTSTPKKKTKIKAIRASDKPKTAKRTAVKKERANFRERKANIKKIAKTKITK